MPQGGACWYRLNVNSSGYRGVRLTGLNSKRVTVTAYRRIEYNDFEYVGTYDRYYDDEFTINVDYGESLYVVVTPTTSYIGGFELQAQLYGSTELSEGAIAGIVLGCIGFVALVI